MDGKWFFGIPNLFGGMRGILRNIDTWSQVNCLFPVGRTLITTYVWDTYLLIFASWMKLIMFMFYWSNWTPRWILLDWRTKIQSVDFPHELTGSHCSRSFLGTRWYVLWSEKAGILRYYIIHNFCPILRRLQWQKQLKRRRIYRLCCGVPSSTWDWRYEPRSSATLWTSTCEDRWSNSCDSSCAMTTSHRSYYSFEVKVLF